MIYGIYAMRDGKSSFLSPNVDLNDATAIRNFDTAIKRSNDVMHFHPQDFQLYRIGHFDTDTGKIIPLEVIELVCDGGQFINEK